MVFRPVRPVQVRPRAYLVLGDLLGDLGRLGPHGLGGAEASLGGAQPVSQRLQGFVELKSQNLQLLQLPLSEEEVEEEEEEDDGRLLKRSSVTRLSQALLNVHEGFITFNSA